MRRSVGQREATMQGGRVLAPHHGTVAPPWGDLRDGPPGAQMICPRARGDWGFVRGLGEPQIWVPCDDAGPGLLDRGISGLTLGAAGTVAYQQTLAGWTRSWAKISAATTAAGFTLAAGAGFDPGMAYLVVVDLQITTTGGNRTWWTGGPNTLAQHNSAGQIALTATGSTVVTGAVDYRSATTPTRYVLYWEPGNYGPSAKPIYKVWTKAEQLQITAGSGPGGIIAFAGDGPKGVAGSVGSSPAVTLLAGLGIWTGWSARRGANLGGAMQGGRTILIASGLEVAY